MRRLLTGALLFVTGTASAAPLGFIDGLLEGEHTRTSVLGSSADVFSPDDGRFRLDGVVLLIRPGVGVARPGVARLTLSDDPPARSLLDKKTVRVAGGVLLAVGVGGYFAWWRDTRRSFAFANERWFQSDTYAGGADKASHFTFSFMAETALENLYGQVGHPPSECRLLAVGNVILAGAFVEMGDGFSQYGFSWEDEVSNVIGSVVSSQVSRLGLRDTLGVRYGIVKALIPDPCCRSGENYGSDYSKEIYSFDVKLAGLLPRLGVRPGLARFLLISGTYGSKGYRYSPAESRQRNVGIEAGLNLPEILRAMGVRDDSWWGKPLLVFLTWFRIPYSSFGWHYDLNHGRWSGPDTGDRFDPGSVTYD